MTAIDLIDVHEPQWITELRHQCERQGRQKVAEDIGYSRATLSQVLNDKYKGNLADVERAVRGAYLGDTVSCPVLGALETNKCLSNQREKQSTVNPLRVQLYRACHGNCPHSEKNGGKA